MQELRYRIGKVYISITDPNDAKEKIEKAVEEKLNTYICVSIVRTLLFAHKNSNYVDVMKNSFMNLPDGMPLVWAARIWGIKTVQRTFGPDLFMDLLSNPRNKISHFLLGDTDDVLHQIEEKYKKDKGSLIVGTYSPPFYDLDEYDYQKYASMINNSDAHIVWIAMRAPKQDFFAVKLLPYLKNKLVIGVGAAFRFAVGKYKNPNKLMQKLGLTGFFIRKIDKHLIITYLKETVGYICLLVDIFFSIMKGKKYFE